MKYAGSEFSHLSKTKLKPDWNQDQSWALFYFVFNKIPIIDSDL